MSEPGGVLPAVPVLTSPDVELLLSVQHQVIARRQLVRAGLTRAEIRSARRTVLRDVTRSVYAERGSTETWRQALWSRWLQVGPIAAVSHESAAALHGLASFPEGPVTFVVPHVRGSKISGVHETREPFMESVEVIDNLPVTSVAQTFWHLAATIRKIRLRDALDDAFARKLVKPEEMIDFFDAMRVRGANGVSNLEEILDGWREDGKVPTRSVLERKTLALFDRFGGVKPIVGWTYPSRTEVPHVADFGDPDALLVLETDGRRWHGRRQQEKRDKERDANAARHGIQVLRVLWEHVVGDPKGTWSLYMDTRATRLRQFGRTP